MLTFVPMVSVPLPSMMEPVSPFANSMLSPLWAAASAPRSVHVPVPAVQLADELPLSSVVVLTIRALC
jgi:hypothetical protein